MATTYKAFNTATDVISTRTLLHEAIPLTGALLSGTYTVSPNTEENIKNYSHGMFQSVFDYPYLSSSANHVGPCARGTVWSFGVAARATVAAQVGGRCH